MLEVLQFVFSSFWIWLGTVILVSVLGSMVCNTVYALREKHDTETSKKA